MKQPVTDDTYKSDFKNPFSNGGHRTMLLMKVHQFYNGMDDDVITQMLEEDNPEVHNLLRNFMYMNISKRMNKVLRVLQESAEYLAPDREFSLNKKYYRQEFIGSQFIFNSSQINLILGRKNQENEFVGQLEKLFDGEKYNSLSFGQPALNFEDGDEKNVYQTIYDNSFLDPAIKFLLSPVLDLIAEKYPNLAKKGLLSMLSNDLHPVVKQVANNLMGVFLGYSLGDSNMIRSSVIELVVNK